ncbi:Chk1 [Kluyveromyces lactis]|nr:Chk1 [Kluyveromyces lactis]
MSFSQIAQLPHIDGLQLGRTIGKGSFAFVKKASLEVDPSTVIAVKFIHLPSCEKQGMSQEDVLREVKLHSRCSNFVNVLKVIDCNLSDPFLWIAMELAEGGDLFDKIEPDIGVDSEVAQFYYKQLINAISYLHGTCGVAHRDIKPENILLDKDGNLKLADFGLASLFKRKDGSKRISRDQRGSLPYMAPEIIYCDGYYADMTDIWSIGVLVFVLLTGETPWELPHEDDETFRNFIKGEGKLDQGSWLKIDFVELNLLRKILQPDPEKRASLDALRKHTWYQTNPKFADENGLCRNPSLLAEKLLSKLKVSLSDAEYLSSTQEVFANQHAKMSFTQPLNRELAHIDSLPANLRNGYSATQKVTCSTNFSSEREFMTQEPFSTKRIQEDLASLQFNINDMKLMPNFSSDRLTKFFSTDDISVILSDLENALVAYGVRVSRNLHDNFLKLKRQIGESNPYPVSIQLKTYDRNKLPLSGSLVIMQLEGDLKSVTFERKRGDPLEWRRFFKRITVFCRDIVYVN